MCFGKDRPKRWLICACKKAQRETETTHVVFGEKQAVQLLWYSAWSLQGSEFVDRFKKNFRNLQELVNEINIFSKAGVDANVFGLYL